MTSENAILGQRTDAPAMPARTATRGEHQAIVVVERRRARAGDSRADDMPEGWKWMLGNCRVGDLFDRLFEETKLTWSCLVVPEEQQATFAALSPLAASKNGLVSYDGQLQIRADSLAGDPDDGEPLFFIFNGYRLPLCDLNHAIVVHRANRCDSTLIDFPRSAPRRAYEENLRINDAGRVARVDRLYESGGSAAAADRDWPAMMVISGSAMQHLLSVELPQRISNWPAAMLRAGLRLKGSTIPGRGFGLQDHEQLYELNDAVLRLRPQWICQSSGLVDQGQKVWVGKDVRIASSAQLIGPIAIGDNVEIGADTVIVGPTTIGKGSIIGANLVLKRCVVMPDTTLASATDRSPSLSHAIVFGSDQPTIQAITAGDDEDGDSQAMSFDRPIKLETVLEGGAVPAFGGFRYAMFRLTKRAVDIAGSLFFLVLSLPLYPLIALAIKINSPGPVFYAHWRQGRGGKNFRCWKFRTMVRNADEIKRRLVLKNEVDGPQFKMKDDPRIFRVGRILRRMNIDEWPQFFNVLIGQMSLVGPRPSPERENQMCPAWREARLSVRPGITGLWQVMRKREEETDFQEWIYYDVQYVKKQSIWLDIKIFFRTFGVMFGGGQ